MNELVLTAAWQDKVAALTKPPRQLFYRGKNPGEFGDAPLVAIVGSRKPTPYGQHVTEKLAGDLARAGVIVVSGLAYGIDCIAHKSALAVGGYTIAVLPSGILNVYPAAHTNLAEEIVNQGCLLSEHEADYKSYKFDFLERNRLIAALSDAVIITEAAERSGSLNTATHARKLSKPVGAIPGAITSAFSAGTNQLIKEGAAVITGAPDVFRLLGIKTPQHGSKRRPMTQTKEALILSFINEGTTDPRELQQRCKLEVADFQTTMTMLELSGEVSQDSLGRWHLS